MSGLIDDLAAAADWLRAYESEWGPIGDNGAPSYDERAQQHLRAAEWLDREIQRRQDEAVIRKAARETGRSITDCRRALQRVRSAQEGVMREVEMSEDVQSSCTGHETLRMLAWVPAVCGAVTILALRNGATAAAMVAAGIGLLAAVAVGFALDEEVREAWHESLTSAASWATRRLGSGSASTRRRSWRGRRGRSGRTSSSPSLTGGSAAGPSGGGRASSAGPSQPVGSSSKVVSRSEWR